MRLLRIEIHDAALAILAEPGGTNSQLSILRVHIGPLQAQGLAQTRTGAAHQSDVVGELLGILQGVAGLPGLGQFVERKILVGEVAEFGSLPQDRQPLLPPLDWRVAA